MPHFLIRHLFTAGIALTCTANICYANAQPPLVSPSPAAHEQAIANVLLGEMAVDRNQLNEANQYYLAATKLSRDPHAAKRTLYLALMAGQDQMALNAAQQWAALAPKNLEAQLVSIDLLLKLNNAPGALPYIKQALKINHHETISALIGELQQAPANIQQSMLAAINALPIEQQINPDLLLISSVLQFQIGSQAQAFKLIDTVLETKPEWPQAIALKTDFLVNSKQVDQAVEFTAAKAKTYPQNLMIQLINAEMLIKANQNEEAEAKLKQLASKPAMRGVALLTLAQLAIQDQRTTEAARYLKEATSDPKQANAAYYLLGEIYQFQKKTLPAIQAYQQVTQGQYYVQAQLKAVMLIAGMGQNEQALDTLSNIKINDTEEARQVVLLQVELLMNMKQAPVALNVLNHAIAAIPNDVALLYARSMVAHKLNDNAQTEKDLKAILAIDPKQPIALNALGYMLIGNPTRYQEALNYTEQALALAPNDPAILDTMGWLQYSQGHYTAASRYLAQAYKLNYDGLVAAHYGEVLWHTGNKVEARKVWQAGLQKFPDNADLQKTVEQYMDGQ